MSRFGCSETPRFDGWLAWAGDKLWGSRAYLELLHALLVAPL